jgi:hypothetical protein
MADIVINLMAQDQASRAISDLAAQLRHLRDEAGRYQAQWGQAAYAGHITNLTNELQAQAATVVQLKAAVDSVDYQKIINAGTGVTGTFKSAEESAKAFSRSFGQDFEEGTNRIGQGLRHIVAEFDEGMRGQRGAMVASASAFLRDTGLMTLAVENLASPWTAVAAAGIAAAAAIAYAFEQAYQRMASIRETQTTQALRGGEVSDTSRNDIAAQFDRNKAATNEYAGTQRALETELNKLPAAAQTSRQAFEDLAKSLAGLQHEEPDKAIEKFVKAAEHSPEALAKLVTEFFNLRGAVDASGMTLVEQVSVLATTQERYDAIGRGIQNARGPILTAGQAARTAHNSFLELALSIGGMSNEFGQFSPLADDVGKDLEKSIQPLKDVKEAGDHLSESMRDLNDAVQNANKPLNDRIRLLNQLALVTQGAGSFGAGEYGIGQSLSAVQPDATAAANLTAQARRMPLSPAEEEAHRITMQNIAAEAEARRGDLEAQRAAAQQRLTEAERVARIKLPTGDVRADPDVQKAAQDVFEAQRKIQDQTTAVTVDGIRARQAEEQRGAQAKVADQQQIIAIRQKEVEEGRRSAQDLAAEQVKLGALVRQANLEAFNEFRDQKLQEIALAKGSVAAITAAYGEIAAKARSLGLPKQATQANTESIKAQQTASAEAFRISEENLSAQNRVAQAQLGVKKALLQEEQLASGSAKAEELRQEQSASAATMAAEIQRSQAVLASITGTSTKEVEEREKLNEQLASLYAKDAETQAQYQEKITAAIEKENKARAEAFTSFFDSIGSTLEKAITGALTGKRENLRDAAKGLIGDVVKGAFGEASKLGAGPLANLFGVTAPKDAGVGQVLGLGVEKLLGLYKDPGKSEQQQIIDLEKESNKYLEAAKNDLDKIAGNLGRPQISSVAPGTGATGGAVSDQASSVAQSAIGYALMSSGQKLKDYCAKLVNDSLEQAGVKGSGSNLAASFKNYGTPVASGQERYGDVFYAKPSGQGDTGHVGYVMGPEQQGQVPVYSSHMQGDPNNTAGQEWRSAANLTFRRPDYGQTGATGGDDATLDYWRRYSYGLGQKVGTGQMTLGQAGQDIEQATGGQVSTQQLQSAMQQLQTTISQQTTAVNTDKGAEDQNTAALKQVKPGTSTPAGGAGGSGDQSTPFQQNLGLLTQGLGIASAAVAAFGGHLSTGARAVLGFVSVAAQLATFIPKVIQTFTGTTQLAATTAQTAILTTISASTTQTAAELAILVAKPSVLGTTFASGGIVYAAVGFQQKGTDTVPAMLTPGESVFSVGDTARLSSMGISPGNVGSSHVYAAIGYGGGSAGRASATEVSTTFHNSFASGGRPFQTRGDWEDMVRGGAGAFSSHVENELGSRGIRFRSR